ncbi:hypothetical protein BXY66_1743 [Shimia isoporae]|uniref:Parallel beta helix pectate lyase-like protein n=1 Tax=Shimia isoporae TaxID=647720 RepID=A0A4R1NMN6_9RHOB|nr:hypothetical protein [Shimia isoporae]TCL09687.1 hypothetical protein BXY66_1743 [Shimia isoporae]
MSECQTILAAPVEGYYDDPHDTKNPKGHKRQIWIDELQTAINRAKPGDEVLLLAGNYYEPVVVNVSGTSGKPICIRAFDETQPPLLDGRRTPADGRHAGMEPLDGDFAFFKVIRAKHIVFKNLKLDRCWPSAFFLRSAEHVTIAKCHALRGRFFVYARQLDDFPTRDILIERCQWVQDPDFDMWEGRVTWEEVKAWPGYRDHSHLNGGFFGSYNIEGGLVIRDCDVSHAFNVVRMEVNKTHVTVRRQRPSIARNKDVAIYRNRFSFIRDNAVEPEKGAQNWYVLENRFYNNHATYSTDLVAMRDVFIIGNRTLNDRRPGRPGYQEYQGGKIFKFLKKGSDETPQPRHNFYSLFNSVQSRTAYSKKGISSQWFDGYTLLGLYPEQYPEDLSKPRMAFHKMKWLDGMVVKGMACTQDGFPDKGNFVDCVGGFDKAFEIKSFNAVPYAPLGGWDGMLPTSDSVPKVVSERIEIDRAAGSNMIFEAGFGVGAQDMAAFGLSGWPFEDMAVSKVVIEREKSAVEATGADWKLHLV